MATQRSFLLAAAVASLCSAWALQGEDTFRRQRVSPHAGGVTLEVFYESMCPYCHVFFNETLRSFWQDTEMRSLVDLRLHPAGNLQAIPAENVSDGYFFWHPEQRSHRYLYICQHGESECIGNLIHMCAQRVLVDPDKYMALYFCMSTMTSAVPEKASFECMQELSIDPEPIRDCVTSPEANEEMYRVVQADVGLEPPRKYVPWVVVNGRHLEIENGQANLHTALCTALGERAPASCLKSLSSSAPNFMRQLTTEMPTIPGPCYWNATGKLDG
mmetsp:Transcript_58430/g.183216  ORF Transcript_58430/g.183216 Transcript_58430/m.183216 type:complete len:273 (-) Transcript_58430:68-886(-)